MSSLCSNYLFFEKECFRPDALASHLREHDRFISAYNSSQRVLEVFEKSSAKEKHWLVFPEYGMPAKELPSKATTVIFATSDEGEAIQEYFEAHPISSGERVCIDSTGFIRPHLLFLLRFLYEANVDAVDVIYSEPEAYQEGSRTRFSSHITEVRQVRGFEGSHVAEMEGEYLLLGCGYDTGLMHALANARKHATKVQVFPFPALRPHMYQENRVRTAECQDAFGKVLAQCFAPGYDPFATAHVLSQFVQAHRRDIKNLYLSPLATKPQVIGFGWFFLMECMREPVSIVFPFSSGYNRETSMGLSETWKYKLDFTLLRSMQTPLGLGPS